MGCFYRCGLSHGNPERVQLHAQGLPRYPQDMRGLGLIASRMAQRLEEQRSFDEGEYLVVQLGGTGLETVLDEPGQERYEIGRFDRCSRDRVDRPGADC